MHVWWGFVAESGHQSDTCVLLSFVRVVWYVCGYPFLAKCSFRSDLSFMSVCMCVLGCAPSLASIYSSLLTHYFSLGIHSCIVYILLLADSLYIPFCTLHTLYTVFLIIAEPKSHTKIWITCAGKYFNLLSMHIMSNITSSSGMVSKQHITKWMGGRACNLFGETSRISNVP